MLAPLARLTITVSSWCDGSKVTRFVMVLDQVVRLLQLYSRDRISLSIP